MNPLLERLQTVYRVDSPDGVGFMREIHKLIAKFTEAEFAAAGDQIIASHKYKTFPSPSEIVNACEEARMSLRPIPKPPANASSTPRGWTAEARSAADRLIHSPMGRDAAHSNWILQLHDFCREYQRLPSQREAAELMIMAREFDEQAMSAMDMSARAEPAQQAVTAKLINTVMDRRRALGDIVLKQQEAA